MSSSVLFWRRLDIEGLERLELAIERHQVRAVATVGRHPSCSERRPFGCHHGSEMTTVSRGPVP